MTPQKLALLDIFWLMFLFYRVSFIHSFIQQMLIKHLLCVRYCVRHSGCISKQFLLLGPHSSGDWNGQ